MVFQEPNFRCRVAAIDRPKKKFARLIYAASEEMARKSLVERHYEVFSVQKYDFNKWKKAAARETARAKKARSSAGAAKRKPFTFKALWGPLKVVLLDLFHGKCAYCDAVFDHVEYGDVEHFRPKAEVTEDPNHPGYWWLAYEPSNYLPSCQLCNQGDAKKNHFPVSGKRAYGPADALVDEQPDLLNPYWDEFGQHLRFYPSTADSKVAGTVAPMNPNDQRGRTAIEICRLNRPQLIDVRYKQLRNALQEFRQCYGNWLHNDVRDALDRFVESCLTGEREFAIATIAEVEVFTGSKGIKSLFSKNGGGG